MRLHLFVLLCLLGAHASFAAVDVTVSQAPSTGAVDAQESYSYTLTVTNVGSTAAASVTLTETVPNNTFYSTSGSSAGWSCSNGSTPGTPCTLSIGALGAGASVNKVFAVHSTYAYPPAGDPGPIGNTACAADPADSNNANNCQTTSLPTTYTHMVLGQSGFSDLDGSGNISCGDVLHLFAGIVGGTQTNNQQNTGLVSDLWVAPQPPDTTVSSGWGLVGGTGAMDNTLTTCGAGSSVLHGQNPGDAYLQAHTNCFPAPSNVNGNISAFNFDVNVSSTAGTLIVDGIAHSTDGFNLPSQLFITVAQPCVLAPDLAVTKTLTSGTVVAGGLLVYNLKLQNLGNSVAGSPVLSDTVPANTTFNAASSSAGWSCANGAPAGSICTLALANLGAGGTVNKTFAVNVVSPLSPAVANIANTGCASTVTTGDPSGNNCSTVTTPRTPQPNMTLTKTASPSPVGPAATLVYTLAYSNTGTGAASNVVLSETVPANTTFNAPASSATWSCANGAPAGTVCTFAVGTVAIGGSGSKLFAVTVANPIPAGVTTIGNTACARPTPASDDADPSNDCGTVSTPTGAPNMTLSKTGSPNPVAAGQTLTYTLSYSNTGTSTATAVVLSETVPANTSFLVAGSSAGWSCANGAPAGTACTLALGDVAAGGSGSKTFAVLVTMPIPVGVTTIGNTACAHPTPASTDANPANDCGSTSTPTSGPNLTVSKTANASLFAPGQLIVYTLNYQNIGNAAAPGVNLTEGVPTNTTFTAASSSPGWSCSDGAPGGASCVQFLGSVPAGATGSRTFAVTVLNPLPAGATSITNAACMGTSGDTDSSNDCRTVQGPTARPDVVATKTAPSPIAPGQILVYSISYQNIGNATANGVVLQEAVPTGSSFAASSSSPGWSCPNGSPAGTACSLSIGTLAPAGNGSRTFAVTVDLPLAPGVTQLDNTICARTTPITSDANNNNDCGSATTPIDAQPDLGITKTGVPAIAPPGSVLTYYLQYDNHGTADALASVIQETVPAHTTFNAASSEPGWSCADGAPAGTLCTLNVGTVTVGIPETVTFAVNVPNPVTVATIANTACILPTPSTAEHDASDNCGSTTNGAGGPDITITKTALPSPVDAGADLTYTIVIANSGLQPSYNTSAHETVPDHTTFLPAQSSAVWSCTPDNNAGASCDASIGTLNAGASATLTFVVKVDAVLAPDVTSIGNTACANWINSPPPPGRPGRVANSPTCATITTPQGGAVNLKITKDDHGTSAHAGDRVWYYLDYTNIGNRTASGAKLSETVPAHSVFSADGSTPGWSCAAGAAAGTHCELTVGSLAQGDTGEAVFAIVVDKPTTATAILNTASIADDATHGPDADPGNNTASDTTPILAEAVHDIPTLGQLGFAVLAFALGLFAVLRLRSSH